MVFAESRLPLEESYLLDESRSNSKANTNKHITTTSTTTAAAAAAAAEKAHGILVELTECQAISDGADTLLAPHPDVLIKETLRLNENENKNDKNSNKNETRSLSPFILQKFAYIIV